MMDYRKTKNSRMKFDTSIGLNWLTDIDWLMSIDSLIPTDLII